MFFTNNFENLKKKRKLQQQTCTLYISGIAYLGGTQWEVGGVTPSKVKSNKFYICSLFLKLNYQMVVTPKVVTPGSAHPCLLNILRDCCAQVNT